ncbi:MAG: hypothetical protein NC182_05410 [Prevotella sp.]|nr:hypothetical protein [Staphylococcus sp.]MCM1350623.1 hypothetical protein [Prevotella sp.]
MKKTTKKILKEDFETTYQPKLKASDVIEKTEYFDMNLKNRFEQNSKALRHYKLSFRVSVVISFLLLFGIISLGYIHWVWDNTNSNQTSKNILTKEEYSYMVSINPYVDKNYQYAICINNNAWMYIYKGFDINRDIDYFYVIHLDDGCSKHITISIDSQEINIDKTSYGYLTKLSAEEERALHFIVNVDGLTKEYTLVG